MRLRLVSTAAVVVAVAALPDAAHAKVSCGANVRPTDVALAGVPSAPVAGRTYVVRLALPRQNAVNPRPMLLAARCSGPDGSYRPGHYPGAGSRPVPGIDDGTGAYTFDLRFEQPGRWRLVAMDRSGTFHDFGFLDVLPATAAPAETKDGSISMVAIAAAAVCVGAAALIARRLAGR